MAARLADVGSTELDELSLAVTIVPSAGVFVGTVAVLAPASLVSERQVVDGDCRAVVRAVAFIAAVLTRAREPAAGAPPLSEVPAAALAPLGEEPAAAPEPVGEEPAPTPTSAPPVAPEAEGREPAVEMAPFLALGLATALAPRVSSGPRLGLGLRGRGRWAPALRLSAARFTSSTVTAPTGEARLALAAVRLDGCLAHDVRRRLELDGCLTAEAGELRGEGSSPVGARKATAVWLSPGLVGRVTSRWVGPLAGYLEGGVSAPIVRPTFYFDTVGDDEVVHVVPPLGFELALGLSLHFP